MRELATFNLQLAATGVAPGRLGDRRPIRPVWPVKQAVDSFWATD